MDEKLKQRLIGAAVLVILMVIFVPILVEDKGMLATDPASMKVPPWPEERSQTAAQNVDGTSIKLPIPNLVKERDERVIPTPALRAVKPKPQVKPKVVKKPKKSGSWSVQAGSFSSKKNTDLLVKKLIKKGLPAYYEAVAVKGKRLYRVRIGRELDKKVAEKYNKQLKHDFKLAGKLRSNL